MARSKDAWLKEGSGDLKEAIVKDVPEPGGEVKVRALPAAYSNQASSEATELRTMGLDQVATINKGKLEVLQWVHGVIEPTFTVAEAEIVAQRFGPAWRKVIDKIDELSAIDKEAIDAAARKFPAGGTDEERGSGGNGTGAGSPGSHIPARVSSGTGQDRKRADDG